MSSNIELTKICQFCNTQFVAKTTVTKYCSVKCASKAYKARARNTKIQRSNVGTAKKIAAPIIELKEKEFLSVEETCNLLGISKRTIYRMFERGHLPLMKIGSRTIIKRSDIDSLLTPTIQTIPKVNETYHIADCYSLKEIQTKYGISDKTLYEIIKRNNIPKIKQGWYTYIPKSKIDSILN